MSEIPVTKITANWRITIPPECREGLEIGDLVIFGEGCIILYQKGKDGGRAKRE